MQKNYKNNLESTSRRHYHAVHYWLKKKFGLATKCENKKCLRKSQKYEWAKRPSKDYDFKRANFRQLCKSCHAIQDCTNETRERMRKLNTNTHKTHCSHDHPFTEDNTRMRKGRISRICRKCAYNASLKRNRKMRGWNPDNYKFKDNYYPDGDTTEYGTKRINRKRK